MEEPARLICPECDLVYRVKRITPGKKYTCKNCGSALAAADGSDAAFGANTRSAGADFSGSASRPRVETASGSDLMRLPKLVEELTQRLESLKMNGEGGEGDSGLAMRESAARLETELSRLGDALNGRLTELDAKIAEATKIDAVQAIQEKLIRRLDEVEDKFQERLLVRFGEVEGRLAVVADKTVDPEILSVVRQEIRESRDSFQNILGNLKEQTDAQQRDFASTLARLQQQGKAQKVELAAALATLQEKGEAQKTELASILAGLQEAAEAQKTEFDAVFSRFIEKSEAEKTELAAALTGIREAGQAQKEELAATLSGILEKGGAEKSELTAAVDALREAGEAQRKEIDAAFLQLRERADAEKSELTAVLAKIQEAGEAQKKRLDGAVAGFLEKEGAERSGAASVLERIEEIGQTHSAELAAALAAFQEKNEEQSAAVASLLSPDAERPATTVEVDIDELADRLAAGMRTQHPLLDEETGKVVDVLAKLADELVKEQSANTVRLDHLATEIHNATTQLSQYEDWRKALPDKVADEIGATVEARVVGPIAGALSRQAPAILSELQDSKLVDIVSRSVREAQRPLLREILSGSRAGLPWWGFMSLLIPLLLIMAFLFWPGGEDMLLHEIARTREEIGRGQDQIIAAASEAADGSAEMGDRLAAMEAALKSIHEDAVIHAQNNARLEEEVKTLRSGVESRDKMLAEYNDVVGKLNGKIRAYEQRLTQLGVSPASVGE